MVGHISEQGDEYVWTYDDDRGSVFMAIVAALLIDAAIVGLFLFITWLMYATD